MKAKNLIKILDLMDPEDEVCFGIGAAHDDEYREICAKAEIVSGQCLNYLRVSSADVDRDTSYNEEKIVLYLNLEQFNLYSLREDAKKFDVLYKRTED